jgi:hypothetical protein
VAVNSIYTSIMPSYNSNLLYEFHKTPFCRTRFLEHEERSDECYKQTSAKKGLVKLVSYIQYFFYFAPILILYFKLKKRSKHNARKIIFGKYKGW